MRKAENELQEITQRIVEKVQPVRIILFGSSVRNSVSEPNDFDLLVVMPSGTHRRKIAQYLYKSLIGFRKPCDIIVTTLDDLEKFKDNPGLIYKTILEEGREVYAA